MILRRCAVLALASAALLGCALPVEQLHLTRSVLVTSGGELDRLQRKAQTAFRTSDTIVLITTVQWPNDRLGAGDYKVRWNWYANAALAASHEQTVSFFTSPFELHGRMPALTLGPGRHKVEVFVDERLLDTRDFEVRS